jgi:16S rRNA processing protein RimM
LRRPVATRVVARIGKPHGVRGEVTVRVHTDDPDARFVVGARFDTQTDTAGLVPPSLTLRSARRHNRTWLLGFDEVPDRTAAERLRGARLLWAADLPEDADSDGLEDGWYEEQLVGMAVERADGTAVGTVSGLKVGAAQDLLVVAVAGGVTAYLPFVEAIVPVVDVDAGRVVVDPPPGLLELNG